MAAAAPIAVAASIASIGFGIAGDLAKGSMAQSQAGASASRADYDAARAERAAEFGRIQADQTDAQLREELAVTVSNIDAIRAASGIDPTSPTSAAIKAEETRVSDRDRFNRVTSLRLQAEEDERGARYSRATANYMREVGKQAYTLGVVNAIGTGFKGLSMLASSMGGRGSGGSYNAGNIGGTGGNLGGSY